MDLSSLENGLIEDEQGEEFVIVLKVAALSVT